MAKIMTGICNKKNKVSNHPTIYMLNVRFNFFITIFFMKRDGKG